MAQNLYVCGAEPGNGKSAIVLAIMEQLSGCAERAGFFRPVINDTPENDAAFGRQHGSRGDSAFPQVQGVYLAECGSHAIVDAGTVAVSLVRTGCDLAVIGLGTTRGQERHGHVLEQTAGEALGANGRVQEA